MVGVGAGRSRPPAGPRHRVLLGLGQRSLYPKPTLMPKIGPTNWRTT